MCKSAVLKLKDANILIFL